MLVLSSPVKHFRKAVVLILLTPLTLTACMSDKGPTVTQAGQILQNHVLQLLKERNARNVSITDPGGKDISCAEGKVKRTFAATGEDLPERKPDVLIDALVGAVGRVSSYEIVSSSSPGKPVRVQDEESRTVLLLSSPRDGLYAISGETPCLAAQ